VFPALEEPTGKKKREDRKKTEKPSSPSALARKKKVAGLLDGVEEERRGDGMCPRGKRKRKEKKDCLLFAGRKGYGIFTSAWAEECDVGRGGPKVSPLRSRGGFWCGPAKSKRMVLPVLTQRKKKKEGGRLFILTGGKLPGPGRVLTITYGGSPRFVSATWVRGEEEKGREKEKKERRKPFSSTTAKRRYQGISSGTPRRGERRNHEQPSFRD